MPFTVRPVHIPRHCWPMNAVVEPTMVCPLCALEKHQNTGLTAIVARNGYIQCQRCERFAAVFAEDGTPIVPVRLDAHSIRLTADAQKQVRAILAGSGGDVLRTFN